MIIPTSLEDYYRDKKIREAVDALLEKIKGDDTPENFTRDEAQTYNLALLMAMQVRADYVNLLFDLWNGFFGEAVCKHDRLQEKFDASYYSTAKIWEEKHIGCSILRRGQGDVEFVLCVILDNDPEAVIWLSAEKLINGDVVNLDAEWLSVDQGPLWSEKKEEAIYLGTERVTWEDLYDNPEQVVANLKIAAKQILDRITAAS